MKFKQTNIHSQFIVEFIRYLNKIAVPFQQKIKTFCVNTNSCIAIKEYNLNYNTSLQQPLNSPHPYKNTGPYLTTNHITHTLLHLVTNITLHNITYCIGGVTCYITFRYRYICGPHELQLDASPLVDLGVLKKTFLCHFLPTLEKGEMSCLVVLKKSRVVFSISCCYVIFIL